MASQHRSGPGRTCNNGGSGAAQLLQEAVGGPFAAPGAKAPQSSLDARRHAACRRCPPTSRWLRHASRRSPACTRGLAAAYAINVRRTKSRARVEAQFP